MFNTRAIAPFIGCLEISNAKALARQTTAKREKQIAANIKQTPIYPKLT
jgi:hypothetical protein